VPEGRERVGQVPGDRRGYLPGEAKLPGAGKALAAKLCGHGIAASVAQHMPEREVRPYLQVPGPEPCRHVAGAEQRGDRVFALVGGNRGEQHRSFGLALLVTEPAGECRQFVGVLLGGIAAVLAPQCPAVLREDSRAH
jgi:hypothetical protein